MKTTMTKRVKVIAVAIVGALVMSGACAELEATTARGSPDKALLESKGGGCGGCRT